MKMNNINNSISDIRTYKYTDGKTYFSLEDACHLFGLNDFLVLNILNSNGIIKAPVNVDGQLYALAFISEGNLYRLIVSSKDPNMIKFSDWIFDVALPNLRNQGFLDEDLEVYENKIEKLIEENRNLMNAIINLKGIFDEMRSLINDDKED